MAPAGRPVEELFLHLALDEGALLLHHDDVFQALREARDALRFQRPGHADLVHADADVGARGFIQAKVFQRLQHVQVALAGGDDAQPRARRVHHHLVDAVGAGERLCGLHRIAVQAHLLVQRRVRPADVEATRGHFEVFRQHDAARHRIDLHRGRRFHRLGNGLEADPAAGVTAHRPAQQAHVEDVLHAGGVENRHHRADEFVFAAVRQGRTAAGMVIGGQRQHAAVARGAGGIGMLEHVAAAVHARALAVPHAEHALHVGAGEQVGLLRAPHHGGAQVLVQARGELHLRRFKMLARAPQFQVEATQRAATIAADEAGAVDAFGGIAQALHQRQPHQRLHATQVDPPLVAGVLVVERVVTVEQVGGRGRSELRGTGHGWPGRIGWHRPRARTQRERREL